jgi:hypothetical protein
MRDGSRSIPPPHRTRRIRFARSASSIGKACQQLLQGGPPARGPPKLKSRTICVEQLLPCASGCALAPRRAKRSPPQINLALHPTARAALFSLRRLGVSCNLKAPPGPWNQGRVARPLQAHRANLRPVCRRLPKVQTKRLSNRPRINEAAAMPDAELAGIQKQSPATTAVASPRRHDEVRPRYLQ